jgi:four helix bundle protein
MALDVWKGVFELTRRAGHEVRPIVDQLVRSTGSIALNIAEGAGEFSRGEKAKYYRIARRSAAESSAALDLLSSVEAIEPDQVAALSRSLDEIGAILTTMAKRQEARSWAQRRSPRAAPPSPSPSP